MPLLEPDLTLSKDIAEELRVRIVERRKEAGITQAALSEAIGIGKARYNHYERGIRRFPLSLIPDIAEALGCSEAELLGAAEAKPQKKRGPASRFEQLGERFAKLPRSKQKVVIEMLESWLDKAS